MSDKRGPRSDVMGMRFPVTSAHGPSTPPHRATTMPSTSTLLSQSQRSRASSSLKSLALNEGTSCTVKAARPRVLRREAVEIAKDFMNLSVLGIRATSDHCGSLADKRNSTSISARLKSDAKYEGLPCAISEYARQPITYWCPHLAESQPSCSLCEVTWSRRLSLPTTKRTQAFRARYSLASWIWYRSLYTAAA